MWEGGQSAKVKASGQNKTQCLGMCWWPGPCSFSLMKQDGAHLLTQNHRSKPAWGWGSLGDVLAESTLTPAGPTLKVAFSASAHPSCLPSWALGRVERGSCKPASVTTISPEPPPIPVSRHSLKMCFAWGRGTIWKWRCRK